MLTDFKNWLILNGASKNTADTYVARISEVGSTLPLENWTKEGLDAFLTKIKQERKTSTFNNYLFAIKKYLAFQKKEIELPRSTRPPKILPESFTEEYFLHTMIPTIEQLVSGDIFKIKALLYFLFYTGLRISEINDLKREHFDLKQRIVKVYISKTKEERLVFYTKATKFHLEEYFNSEPEETNAFNMTSKAFQARLFLWKPHFEEINLHAHIFRHSYATHLLYNGVNLLSVGKLLGHKDIMTTQRYESLSIGQMQEIYRAKIDRRGK